MVDDNNNIDDSLAALEQTSQILTNAVTDMSKRLTTTQKMQDQLKKQQDLLENQVETNKKQGVKNTLLFLSILFDVGLSIVLSLGLLRIDGNAQKISDLQNTVNSDVLCAEADLWLGILKDSEQRPNLKPKQRQQIADFKLVFNNVREALECP